MIYFMKMRHEYFLNLMTGKLTRFLERMDNKTIYNRETYVLDKINTASFLPNLMEFGFDKSKLSTEAKSMFKRK